MPNYPLEGGCDCAAQRYRVTSRPLFVHACHCRWCQRETGTAFALNAWIESDRVVAIKGDLEIVPTPSASGRGQRIARCPLCRIALWSHYSGTGPVTKFVRVGTLDDPGALAPDVHIYTYTKQPWVMLNPAVPAFPEFYDPKTTWPADTRARFDALKEQIKAYKTSLPPQA